MQWIEWLSGLLGGKTKSLGSLGVGLKAALSGVAPGGWASDHREETAHNTGFNYIAIHAIAAQVAGATVTVFADGDYQSLRQSRRKTLASCTGTFTRWKSTYGADDRETDPLPTSHPLVRLLRRPNPHESGANFRYRQAQQMRLTGTCLIWNVPSISGQTCERYVVPTAMASPVAPTVDLPRGGWRINPIASRYTPVTDEGYVECPSWYRILGQIVDARQMQVIRLPHAWFLDDGQSPLSAGAKWVDAGEAVDEARYHQLKNGIDPSVVWNLPPDVSPDQDEMDRVQAKISAKYGGPANVGRVMVAQSGTSITPLSTTPKDMCYTEGFQDFKAAVLALHQTPPVAVGLQEPGAYAAYNASMKAWRHAAIQPLCDMLAESDTEQLAPQFGHGLTIEIESDTVDDSELIEQQLHNDLAAKVRTKNEWRAVRGMKPLPGTQGDEIVGTDSTHDAKGPSGSGTAPEKKWRPQGRDSGSHSYSDEGGERETFETDDDQTRAELIADLLYGLYGNSAHSVVNAAFGKSQKLFNPDLHPRDLLGKFIDKPSVEEINEARQAISEVLQGHTTHDKDPRVLNALCRLTRSQLEELHREHGFAAPPHERVRLVESIRARLLRPVGLGDSEVAPITYGVHPRSTTVDVYVQKSSELTRIMGREITPEQWGQLVGAQPGARVYVYPVGFSTVQVAIEHRDYWARRSFTRTQINNEVFGIAKNKQGSGLGFKIFDEQVTAAVQHGFKTIVVGAMGVGEKLRTKTDYPLGGYYTWARFGFSGEIAPLLDEREQSNSPEEVASVGDFRSKFPNVKNVHELMKTQQGRDWWRNYGGHFEGEFDLAKGSDAQRIRNEYRAEKDALKKKPNRRKTDVFNTTIAERTNRDDEDATLSDDPISDPFTQEGVSHREAHELIENPDILSPEDEMILDRIWDRLGRESDRDLRLVTEKNVS